MAPLTLGSCRCAASQPSADTSLAFACEAGGQPLSNRPTTHNRPSLGGHHVSGHRDQHRDPARDPWVRPNANGLPGLGEVRPIVGALLTWRPGAPTRSARRGSIAAFAESGPVTGGLMHAIVRDCRPFVLVGSVRTTARYRRHRGERRGAPSSRCLLLPDAGGHAARLHRHVLWAPVPRMSQRVAYVERANPSLEPGRMARPQASPTLHRLGHSRFALECSSHHRPSQASAYARQTYSSSGSRAPGSGCIRLSAGGESGGFA
jgi:hypothetical protein